MPRRRSDKRRNEGEADFESGVSGASLTHPVQCSALRKNGHVLISGKPCKIADMFTSQPGKHGPTKIHIVGIDVFTGKRYEDVCPSGSTIEVPEVIRREMQVLGVDRDGYFTLLEENGVLKQNLRHDDQCAQTLDQFRAMKVKADEVDVLIMGTVLAAMGEEMVKEFRITKP